GASVAGGAVGKPCEIGFVIGLLGVILVGRLMGELMQRIGPPAVMGQLLGGLLLGPSVFGALAPDWQQALFAASPAQKSMLDAVSQLGVLMLLLLTGMENDLNLVRRVGRAAASVSVAVFRHPSALRVATGRLHPHGSVVR